MEFDYLNDKPVADQPGKYVRQLDYLKGLPGSFGLSAVSNEDDLGISVFADLVIGSNLEKDDGVRVSGGLLDPSDVSSYRVVSDFFTLILQAL